MENKVFKKLKKYINRCDIKRSERIINKFPNIINKIDGKGYTLLFRNYIKYYENFKSKKEDIDKRVKLMEFLLSKGADINQTNNDCTLLEMLCYCYCHDNGNFTYENFKKFIRIIFKYNVDISKGALHYLFVRDYDNELSEIMEMLIESNIDSFEILSELLKHFDHGKFDLFSKLIIKLFDERNIGKIEYEFRDSERNGNPKLDLIKNKETKEPTIILYDKNATFPNYLKMFEIILKHNHMIEIKKLEGEIEKLKKENEELQYQPGNLRYWETMADFNNLEKKMIPITDL